MKNLKFCLFALSFSALSAAPVFAENPVPAEIFSEEEIAVDPFEIEPLRENFLAKNGRIFAGIFLSADGPENEEISAALDIAEWLGKVAGAKPPEVKTEGDDPRSLAEIPTGIYVGNTRAAGKLGIFAPAGEGETGIIETRGNAIFIVGKTPATTAVLAGMFLRDALGIEFVWPGEDGAEWSPSESIPFPRVRREFLPAFRWRLISGLDGAWTRHLGFGGLPRFSHNLGGIFTKEIFAEKPELAPIVFDESRPNWSGGYAPQPNLAHEDAVPVTLDAAKKFFEKNPAAPMFSVGINDSTAWDESPASEAIYGDFKFFRNLPNRSDYYFAFVNRVAEAFSRDAEFEDKKVGAIAYMDVQDAPTFPMRANVVPVLCADRSMWVFPQFKTEDKNLMKRWANSGVETWGVYDYYYGSPYLFPRLFLDEEAEAIKFVHANGGKIFYAESGAVVPFDAPKIWLAAELLRDPAGDPKKILDDYYEKTFGEAAPAMKNFYATACEIWKNQGGQFCWLKAWNNENSIEIFPPEKLSALRSAVDSARGIFSKKSAEQLSPRERRIRSRIQSVDTNLARAEKFAESYFARKTLGQNALNTAESTLAALKNPAWRMEEIYDAAKFSAAPQRANISAYRFSDPRPAALKRALDFLKTLENGDDRERIERALERVFDTAMRSRAEIPEFAGTGKTLSASDARLRQIAESIPAFFAAPDTVENFEAENCSAFAPGDWRARKNILYPRGWRCILAAAENFEMKPVAFPHGGETALRIVGSERAELKKRYRVSRGQKVLAQVFARGNVSCGSSSQVCIDFFDSAGKLLATTAESLLVGKNENWRELVALGEAPAGTTFAEISLYVGHQAPDDETFWDDFSALVF